MSKTENKHTGREKSRNNNMDNVLAPTQPAALEIKLIVLWSIYLEDVWVATSI